MITNTENTYSTHTLPYPNHHPLRRVRIIRAAKRRRATITPVRLNNPDNGPPRAGPHEEQAREDDKARPGGGEVPADAALLAVPVVMEPHSAHGQEAQEGAEQRADQGDEAAEDGDRRGDDVGDDRDGERAADPRRPVDEGVGGEVPCVAEEADEDELSGDLAVVSKLLDGASTAEG